LTVDGKTALDDVDDLAVVRHGNGLSRIKGAVTSPSVITPPLMPTTPREFMAVHGNLQG
jgi:hypothetical protein